MTLWPKKGLFRLKKKASTNQYDYMKYGHTEIWSYPNTSALEQQVLNKTKKKTEEEGKNRGVSMERSKAISLINAKKTEARVCRLPGSLSPEVVDELPN